MSAIMPALNPVWNQWEDNEQLKEIRKLFAPKATDIEFQFFIGLGKATNLNPFAREIWCVKYHESSPAQIFVGRDGYRKAAQSHSDYDFHQCDSVYENDDFFVTNGEVHHKYNLANRGNLIGAYCIAKRRKSSKYIYVFSDLKEYSTEKNLWNPKTGKPATMIKKVAESQCLRACFQDLLGGTYGEEEMDNSCRKLDNIHYISESSQKEKLRKILDNTIIYSNDEKIIEYDINSCASKEKLCEIQSLIIEKELTDERKKKALAHYKVERFEDLTEIQASLFISQLKRL